jgi:Flp pilus assembly protein TadB
VTIDTELEMWRREWRNQTEPFPALKRKIRRQNLRIVAAVAAIALCLVLATVGALRSRSSFMFGLVTGIAFAGVFQGGYAWWVRRGAWKPAAQTTLAYRELSHKRALATARTTRFSFYFLLIGTVLYAAFSAWNWRSFSTTAALVLAALVIEMVLLGDNRRRAKREIEETSKLLEQTRQLAELETER